MTQNNIENHWSLMSFARTFGPKMFVGECTNQETGECFMSISFHDGSRQNSKMVNFSSNLGALTPQEIVSRKDSLQVVQLRVAPEVLARRKAAGRQLESYILCTVGENSWQEVDLGL